MAIDERSRHRLYQRLEEVLGADEAPILMAHLPPVGWADVATKHDLDLGLEQLEQRLELRFESLEHKVGGQISELRAELHREIGGLSNRVTALVITGLVGVGGLAFAAARLV